MRATKKKAGISFYLLWCISILVFIAFCSRQPDTLRPDNIKQLKATMIGKEAVRLTWVPADSPDVDLVRVVYDTSVGYPGNANQGIIWAELSPEVTSDTITGIDTNKVYYIALYCRDRAGNWSTWTKETWTSIGPHPGYEIIRDIPYCQKLSDIRKLDLYLPDQKGHDIPVVLMVHGGGWRAGGPKHWERLARYLAENGFACASVAYRLSPEYHFPAHIEDIRLAMAWLKTDGAQQYGFDPERIGAVGSSAGGHLVALLSTIGPKDSLGVIPELKVRDTRPAATICYNPVTNFLDKPEMPDLFYQFFGCTVQENRPLYESASPALRISGKEPPFLLLNGTADTVTPISICEDMVSRLKQKGVEARLVALEGMPHGFGYKLRNKQQWLAANETLKFLKSHLSKVFHKKSPMRKESVR